MKCIDQLLPKLIIFLEHFFCFKTHTKLYFNNETRNLLKNNKPVIFIFWHHNIPIFLYKFRNKGIYPLVSFSKDAEFIILALKKFGYGIIRGSSTAGGFHALQKAIETIKKGKSVAISPDGPVGPIFSFKKGAIFLAKRTGVPLVPVGTALEKKWILNSWDKMNIPKPYSWGVITVGEPIYIHKNANIKKMVDCARKCLLKTEKKAEIILQRKLDIIQKK
jgi:lysophospholipid acyltransferase (LPLAT)-like uncharacterized protein